MVKPDFDTDMAQLLFSLRGVPEDEAWDIRELLDAHEIDYYETSAGNWGISTPALWLRDERQLQEAQRLIAAYQQQRAETQRALYQQLKAAGEHKTLFRAFKENPLQFLMYLGLIYMVLYFSIKFILDMNR